MRSKEFVTESAKLWSAKVRVNQPNYVGYVDAQVWAANAQQARTILKQQFNIEDHHVGSVKEIKMKAKEFIKEASQVPLGEELNPNLGKILAAANKFASSVANMKIYVDDLFANHLKFGGLTTMVDWYKKNYTDKDYANAKQEAASSRQELERLGVKVDYNESFPTDFTLNIPGQSQPYSFNIIKLLKDAMDTFSTKATK
jgi:hypothetical protein